MRRDDEKSAWFFHQHLSPHRHNESSVDRTILRPIRDRTVTRILGEC